MRRISFRSIQTRIFFYISFIVMGVIAGAIFLYLFTTSYNMRSSYIETSNQMAKILSARLDDVAKQTNAIQVKILESDKVREYVFSGFSGPQDEVLQKRRNFEETILAIAGYDYPFYHMTIYTLDGNIINFGRSYDYASEIQLAPPQQEYVRAIIQNRGNRYLTGLDTQKLYSEDASAALARAFSRYHLNEPRAVIELQISHAELNRTISSGLQSYKNKVSAVVVYDEKGELVYPKSFDRGQLPHYISLEADKKEKNPHTGTNELVSKFTSAYTGWTVCVVTPYSATTAGMRQYIASAAAVGLVAIILASLIAFVVAKNISAPIIAIKESLLKVDLDTLSSTHSGIKTNYDELELLQGAVEEMQEKLERSLNDYVTMRSLSIQSRLLALQSQMNPHFLYNTLSIMAIIAEENNDDAVSDMCRKLVAMLRYTSTEHENTTLRQEIEHTKQYADLMRVRFGRNIKIEYDIDPALTEISMPPIIVQPLVENSVKYGRSPRHPLHITVKAYRKENRWYVCVSDNGDGFGEQALADIWNKIKQKANWDKIIRHEEEGVGLANIYLRLKLYYEGDFEFDIINSERGASIVVGGKIIE